ncbi:ankyrin repeat domain-containing protein [Stenotrophomonas maltophilia]|uniref:ankyrin repeat domain-containing protein n=1 Tax=Stenotrophomonas maltophilia TaxID=40324 RepID=UPI000C146C9D|nr:ankyrin repeat domain-containing protein [Stenotrophomonas maltophilia]
MADNNDSIEESMEEWKEKVEAARREQLNMERWEQEEKEEKQEREKLLKQHTLETAIEFTQKSDSSYSREIGFELIKGAIANGSSADGWYLYDDLYSQQEDLAGDPYVLRVAEINRSEDIVKHMIDHGARINSSGENDRTLLHAARTPEFVDYLMENGFQRLHDENEQGWTAMHEVIEKENVPVAKRMVEHGLGLSDGDKTLLTTCESAEMAQFLIDQGADVNQQDSYGNTALHRAAAGLARNVARNDQWKSEKLINVLLQSGADPEMRNIAGKNAVERANEYGGVGFIMQKFIQQNEEHSPHIPKQREHERNHSPSFSR